MDSVLRTERVALLGLLTLLGATTTLPTAVAAMVVSLAAAVAATALGRLTRVIPEIPEVVRWSLLIAVGFGVSWLLTELAPQVLPVRTGAIPYLRLAGIAPIVFLGEARETTVRDQLMSWFVYIAMLAKMGFFRELFGNGTIWGYLVTTGFIIPADFFVAPIGAFLLLGAAVLATRMAVRFIPSLERLI